MASSVAVWALLVEASRANAFVANGTESASHARLHRVDGYTVEVTAHAFGPDQHTQLPRKHHFSLRER